MTLGVIIIAHNEEKNIARCLESILAQTRKPDGIWLVAHNCNDRTVDIARQYTGVTVVEYAGPAGIIYARTRAFEAADTDLVASIDADSWADKNWLRGLAAAINKNGVSGAGGIVIFRNSFWARLLSYNFFYIQPLYQPKDWFYFWGSNYICRRKDFEKVGGIKDLIQLHGEIGLHYAAEDLYLALKLKKLGRVVFAPGAKVYSNTSQKEGLSERTNFQHKDKLKLFKHFGLIK